jgi:hypothetical protein
MLLCMYEGDNEPITNQRGNMLTVIGVICLVVLTVEFLGEIV